MRSLVVALSSIFILSACNTSGFSSSSSGGHKDVSNESTGITDGVVKAIATIPVVVDGRGNIHIAASKDYPVTIINPANVKFEIKTDGMTVPPVTNAMLDFGKMEISELFDNNLNVCGPSKNTKCSKAYIQAYTTGTAGAGLWNAAGGYGMPIYMNLTGSARLSVGLNAANAAVLQTLDISSVKNVIRLSDFVPAAIYEAHADFTEAGAGSYSTTLVMEYGLVD